MHKLNHTSTRRLVTGTALVGLALNALAGDSQPAAAAASDPSSAAGASPAVTAQLQKPDWLTDLSLGLKESYDDNVLLVADKTPGMSAHASWVTAVSPKVGFNFAPLLGDQQTLQTLSLVYAPDFTVFENAPSESYNAHKIGDSIKGKTGDFSFSGDNAFLFVDGNSQAPIYAANQTNDQLDKNRSAYATAAPRERREQIQDRTAISLQYDVDKFFVRPTASLLDYDLMTDLHNAGAAPYLGYQNYASRMDVNGGTDVGYKVIPDLAVTLGYRYGHQYQQAFAHNIDTSEVNGQQANSSSDYQRILLGIEGQPLNWLSAKMAGGPDFRTYNSAAPVNDYHPVKYYGEASLTATITPSQSLTFTYKQWQWVSSTGKLPYFDSTYALAYHWNATGKLGFDLGAKFLESDYNSGSTAKIGTSCLRDDGVYDLSAGVSYAFTSHLSGNLTYAYDFGRNLQDLPSSLASTADYRQFDHQVVSLGMVLKF